MTAAISRRHQRSGDCRIDAAVKAQHLVFEPPGMHARIRAAGDPTLDCAVSGYLHQALRE